MSLQSKENSQQNRETTYKKIEEQKQPTRKQSAEWRNNLQNERKCLETI